VLLGREIDSLVCKSFRVRIAFPWDIHYAASEESLQKYMHPISKVLDTAMTNCPLPDHLLHSNHKRTPHLIKQRRHVVKKPVLCGYQKWHQFFDENHKFFEFSNNQNRRFFNSGYLFPLKNWH